tara:strand:+ start:107 stop:307 length:201 start_codon:yes stop_codon:yes gene_type:complete
MELTEGNALFTYLERCKAGAKTFASIVKNMTEEERRRDQDFITKLVCESWQVEALDMLAETNTTWK